jgi:hypothetical protein
MITDLLFGRQKKRVGTGKLRQILTKDLSTKKAYARREIISDLAETDISEDTDTGDVIQVFPYNPKTKC